MLLARKAPLYNADGGRATGVGDGKALAAARGGVPHARADGRGVRGVIDQRIEHGASDAARQR